MIFMIFGFFRCARAVYFMPTAVEVLIRILTYCHAIQCISAAFAAVWLLDSWISVCDVRALRGNGYTGHSCYGRQIGNLTQAFYCLPFSMTLSDL